MGDQSPSRPLQRLIGEGTDIAPIRARLLAPHAPLAAILAEFTESTN
jgi:hypothetical protein